MDRKRKGKSNLVCFLIFYYLTLELILTVNPPIWVFELAQDLTKIHSPVLRGEKRILESCMIGELKELLGSNSSGKLQANNLVADSCKGLK